jgi:CO dehydrogenase nickel-insertion accessory protein CooC1
MKIAVSGKGGTGKTFVAGTMAARFAPVLEDIFQKGRPLNS